MIFLRREGRPSTRFLGARVGLFFLGAGLWLAGVSVASELVTWIAMAAVVAALLLGLAARRM